MGALYSVVRTHPLDGSFLSCHKLDCCEPTPPYYYYLGKIHWQDTHAQNVLPVNLFCKTTEDVLNIKLQFNPCKFDAKSIEVKFPSWHVILSEQKTNIKIKIYFFPCHIGVLISPATTNHPASLLFNFHSLWQTLSSAKTSHVRSDHDQYRPWPAALICPLSYPPLI